MQYSYEIFSQKCDSAYRQMNISSSRSTKLQFLNFVSRRVRTMFMRLYVGVFLIESCGRGFSLAWLVPNFLRGNEGESVGSVVLTGFSRFFSSSCC